MFAGFDAFSDDHPVGENGKGRIAPPAPRPALLLLLADLESASTSRLARHAASGTLGRVQLPDLG
jgi:hypothetical protein